ncbi:aminotransferase class III-fold pyridoxal phosphate-dependent enzyme [Adhaeribacter sp. BT258]|uniref:Aminotransferase class III-fold pyridoxal phosphate-dependent enzyme n=1 Tax=Adhaeribacter terrigena TaxID=2793070 RepID=A0ABS1C2X3_9BACT|nr:aminotransferase class III-fold pyridoxal phosphate-dependent enzyme [Adhaeribacter terrigena]MBK0403753.1 aminotransferase class III-fold pyridoxal phosphate-dependent enzyme [Adhaeribacter terrigena]
MEQVLTSEREEIVENNLQHTLFSWQKQAGLKPLVINKAEGVYIWDMNGKRYLDFSSQLVNMNIGHGHPAIAEAVYKQMQEVSYVYPGMVTKARGELAKKLAEVAPGNLTKTLFTLGGADAIENAIKLARLHTGRHKIVALYQSYHGATHGAMAAGGDPRKLQVDAHLMPNVVHVENPHFYRCPWHSETPEQCRDRAIEHLERVVGYEGPDNIAAMIMEGESGTSGCIKYPPGYLKKVKQICEKHGILFIADEVMSGFGRTGKWFGVQNHDVEPDLLCFAKGATAGYLPLGGMMVSEEIARTFDEKPLPLGLTYSAHPVSCAAGVAVMEVYEKENLVERAAELGKYMEERVAALMQKHPSIGDFRNTGLLGCLELVKNRQTKVPMAPWNANATEMKIMSQLHARLFELGMYTMVRWNYVFICPPLTITEAQIDEGLEIISEALKIADAACN